MIFTLFSETKTFNGDGPRPEETTVSSATASDSPAHGLVVRDLSVSLLWAGILTYATANHPFSSPCPVGRRP